METLLKIINRIRNFDYRKLTPQQIIVGVASAIIAMWLIGQVVGFITNLVPVAILVLILYFGFRFLNNRSEAAEDEAEAKEEKIDEAPAVVIATQEEPTIIIEEATAPVSAPVVEEVEELEVRNLKIEPKINPKTGLPEADLSRLIEMEEEAIQSNEDMIKAQLEERRRRLMGGDS